jgi:hypothetical protein
VRLVPLALFFFLEAGVHKRGKTGPYKEKKEQIAFSTHLLQNLKHSSCWVHVALPFGFSLLNFSLKILNTNLEY